MLTKTDLQQSKQAQEYANIVNDALTIGLNVQKKCHKHIIYIINVLTVT